MNASDIVLLVGLLGCFALAAMLAVAEVSFVRVRRSSVLVAAEHGDRRAAQLLALLDDFPVVLNSVLLLVLTAQVGAATIAGYLAQQWFGDVAVTITSVIVTAVLFVYAEAIPKTIAVRSPDTWSRRLTPLMRAISVVLRPVVAVLVRLANWQSPGDQPMVGALTEEEIRALAKESAEVGTIDEDDAELVDRSFEFGDLTIGDVMVPRDHIAWIDVTEPVIRAFPTAIASGHRRFPVVASGLDDVVGIIQLRDIALAARSTPLASVGEVTSGVLRCAHDEPIADVLDEMQERGIWMAIVVDDDRTIGLATIEDIVAELVGEIADDAWKPRSAPTKR